MSGKMLIKNFAAVALLLVSGTSVFAQKDKKRSTQDPTDKPITVKNEVNKAYKDWVNKDVILIITQEEKKAFNKLTTDEERENFITQFWARRDPDPPARGIGLRRQDWVKV